MLWTCFLLAFATLLEKLTQRPFLATRMGALFALSLGGRRLDAYLFEVPQLPAVGFRAAAQTWGETVLVTPGSLGGARGRQLIRHELCHVAQYRRLTSLGFWLLYVWQWLRSLIVTRNAFRAYWEMPLEREARSAAEADLTV